MIMWLIYINQGRIWSSAIFFDNYVIFDYDSVILIMIDSNASTLKLIQHILQSLL